MGFTALPKRAPETGVSRGYQRRPQRRAWDAKAADATTKKPVCKPRSLSTPPLLGACAARHCQRPVIRDNFPGTTHGVPQAGATSCCPLPPQASPHPYTSLPPDWVSQSPRSSCPFNPALSEGRIDALKWPTRRGGSKSKAEPRELYEQRRKREISSSSLRSSGLKLHKQLDVPASVGYLNRQQIIPNWGGGLWQQDILFFPLFLFLWVYMCMLLCEILSVQLCFHHWSKGSVCLYFLFVSLFVFYLKFFFFLNFFLKIFFLFVILKLKKNLS